MTYVKPEIVDYGTLTDLTEATTIFGPEDGASKIEVDNHHSAPQGP